VGGETANGFTLLVTGYATSRTLTGLNVTFTPATGFSFPSSQFTVDLTQAATTWFQSSASLSFGGQFEATVPFTLQGTPPKGETLIQALASVAVTATNELGTSNSLSTSVQ
jgi:hypothetical protein